MTSDAVRELALWQLRGGDAHVNPTQAFDDLPEAARSRRPAGIPHTPWRLLEHMRIAQWDILEFSRNAEHESPEFPDGYWPSGDGPPSADAWSTSLSEFQRDSEAFRALIADPRRDLLEPLPWGEGQSLLREALVLADHNAYHTGQLMTIRRALGVPLR